MFIYLFWFKVLKVQITGVITLVMVPQLADREMMDAEVCILRLRWSHRGAGIKRTDFFPGRVQRAQSKCFTAELLAPHFKCIINWQVVIRLSPAKMLFLVFLPGDERSNSWCQHALINGWKAALIRPSNSKKIASSWAKLEKIDNPPLKPHLSLPLSSLFLSLSSFLPISISFSPVCLLLSRG